MFNIKVAIHPEVSWTILLVCLKSDDLTDQGRVPTLNE